MYEMRIKGLGCCPVADRKTVILEDLAGEKFIPIWLNPVEFQALSFELREPSPFKPTTHHLLLTILETVRGRIKYLVIHELRDNVFYASISLDFGGSEVIVDCGAFDALMLALKAKAPLYVSQWVMKVASRDVGKGKGEADSERWKRWIAGLKPGDFRR